MHELVSAKQSLVKSDNVHFTKSSNKPKGKPKGKNKNQKKKKKGEVPVSKTTTRKASALNVVKRVIRSKISLRPPRSQVWVI